MVSLQNLQGLQCKSDHCFLLIQGNYQYANIIEAESLTETKY